MILPLLLLAHAAPGDRLRIAGFDDLIAIPGTAVLTVPVHPGLAVGASLWGHGSERLEQTLWLELAGYRHRPVESALLAGPSWRGTWRPAQAVGLSTGGGVAYKHALYPAATWQRTGTEPYERRRHPGHPELSVHGAVGVEVRLHPHLALFAEHRGSLEGPFSPELAPVMFHARTQLGLQVRR